VVDAFDRERGWARVLAVQVDEVKPHVAQALDFAATRAGPSARHDADGDRYGTDDRTELVLLAVEAADGEAGNAVREVGVRLDRVGTRALDGPSEVDVVLEQADAQGWRVARELRCVPGQAGTLLYATGSRSGAAWSVMRAAFEVDVEALHEEVLELAQQRFVASDLARVEPRRLVASRVRVAVGCPIVDLAERYRVVGASACHVVKIASSRSRSGIGSVQGRAGATAVRVLRFRR
jgi:hypothetical protein